MERFKLRRLIEDAFDSFDKEFLYDKIKSEDLYYVLDILWEYMIVAEEQPATQELEKLRKMIKTLDDKSGQRAKCLQVLENRRALIQHGPLKEEVMISPSVDISKLKLGTEVLVIGNAEGRIVSGIRESSTEGKLSKVQRVLDNGRIVIDEGGNQIILKLIEFLKCKDGDEVRYDPDSQIVLEIIHAKEQNEYTLSVIPTETFDDVKGLEKEKKYLLERIIYPSVYREKFEKYGIKPVKGAILYGASGCGKSLLASAIFNEMAKVKYGALQEKITEGFFVINGPSLLSKWAGNTEASIRKIFNEARLAAKKTGFPSIIFWDEIESITGKRKDTATYTPEKTVVPTLLAELQGIKKDNDVILIGASNRPDLIDAALMRPGRLGDIILEIPRPEKEAAKDIINAKISKNSTPVGLKELIEQRITDKIISHIYDNEKPLTVLKMGKIPVMRQQMINGALFANIGEELIRRSCLVEINNSAPLTVENVITFVDEILLMQLGVLDSVNIGFDFDFSDYTLDVSLE